MEITKVLGTVAMVPKGEYDAEEYYEYLNVVTYNGSSYMARKSSHGVLPTDEEYWQLVAQKGARTYQSVADMKSDDDLKEGMVAETLGYYEANDGGAAKYKIRTKTNDDVVDNGYIVSLYNNSIIAELILENDYINIKQLGASESLSDNTSIIQNALNKTLNVFIPKGQYKVTNLTSSNNSQFIRGEGGASLVSKADGNTLLISGNNWKIDTLSIKQSDDTSYENNALVIDGKSGLCNNLSLYKCYNGIYCTASSADCLFNNTSIFSGVNVSIRVYTSGIIFNNFIIGYGGVVGIIAEKGGGVLGNGRIFCCTYGLRLINAIAWTISNIGIQQCDKYGMLIENSSNNIITGLNLLGNNQDNNDITTENSSNLVIKTSHNNNVELVSQEQLDNENWSSNPANTYYGDYNSYNNQIKINQLKGNNSKYASSYAQYPNNSYGLYKYENPSNKLELNGKELTFTEISLYSDTTTADKFKVDSSANQANMSLTPGTNGFSLSIASPNKLMNNPSTTPENRVNFSFNYSHIIEELRSSYQNSKTLSLDFDYEISDDNVGGCVFATIWYNSVSSENRKYILSSNAWSNLFSFTGKGHISIPLNIEDNKNNASDVLHTSNILFNFCRTAYITGTPTIKIDNIKLVCGL